MSLGGLWSELKNDLFEKQKADVAMAITQNDIHADSLKIRAVWLIHELDTPHGRSTIPQDVIDRSLEGLNAIVKFAEQQEKGRKVVGDP